jgi:DNA-binding MarR family transcriptional regulator
MFKKGWVNVERFENDRRRLKITLTEEGKGLAQWLKVSTGMDYIHSYQ